ncbi:MAG: alkaline phosphatase D family protein, partial [Planctomycetia bacterium]
AAAGLAWALDTGAQARAARAAPPAPSVPLPRQGPMVGHTTPTTCSLWASAGVGARLSVALRRADEPASAARRLALVADGEDPAVQRITLTGLAPATRYAYQLAWNEHVDEGWAGGFATPRPEGTPGLTRLATSSCMKPSFPGTSFELLRQAQPGFHLLLGDNAYHDSTLEELAWRGHREMRSVPQLARLLREVPTYAIWDDHDYAGNNTDGTAVGKRRALRCFRALFANPSYGLPGVPGVFCSFRWNDLEVFLLDVRYHRSPNKQPDGPEKRVLGAAQMAWLADGLAASRAPFKLVASGSVLDSTEGDSWQQFPTDRARLFALLRERAVGGVVFLTGDLHRCELHVHPPALTGTYGVPEVISSGIANSKQRGFAVLEADTAQDDPVLGVRLVDGQGRTLAQQAFRRSALQPYPRPGPGGPRRRPAACPR